MSSKAALAFLLLVPFSATALLGAEPLTAAQAMANYHRTFAPAGDAAKAADCPKTEAEITVCGRRAGPPDRLPLPVESEPGERERLIAGEIPRAMAPTSPLCASGQVCGGGLLGGAAWLVKGIRTVLDKRD